MLMMKNIAAAVALAAALTTPVAALQASERGTVAVTYADLNLSSDQGREVFDRRIKHAVEKICGRFTGKVGMDASIRVCQRETLAAAHKSRDVAIADYASKRLAKADDKNIRLIAQ